MASGYQPVLVDRSILPTVQFVHCALLMHGRSQIFFLWLKAAQSSPQDNPIRAVCLYGGFESVPSIPFVSMVSPATSLLWQIVLHCSMPADRLRAPAHCAPATDAVLCRTVCFLRVLR